MSVNAFWTRQCVEIVMVMMMATILERSYVHMLCRMHCNTGLAKKFVRAFP